MNKEAEVVIRLRGKWHRGGEGEMAAIFPHTCLFMLNSPWVTARPWQNKIRVPLCTSVSLSHGMGWQVSRGEERRTVRTSISHHPTSSFMLSLGLAFHISLCFSQPPFHTLFITRSVSAPFLPSPCFFFFCLISLRLSPSSLVSSPCLSSLGYQG